MVKAVHHGPHPPPKAVLPSNNAFSSLAHNFLPHPPAYKNLRFLQLLTPSLRLLDGMLPGS